MFTLPLVCLITMGEFITAKYRERGKRVISFPPLATLTLTKRSHVLLGSKGSRNKGGGSYSLSKMGDCIETLKVGQIAGGMERYTREKGVC